MKTVIVYYSEKDDSVDFIAKQIASIIDADLLRLSAAETDIRFRGYYYTCLIFGCPVFHGTIAPPIKEFIQKFTDEFYEMEFAAFMWRDREDWNDSFKELKKLVGPLRAEMMFTGNQEGKVNVFCKSLKNRT